MKLINGKKISNKILKKLKFRVSKFPNPQIPKLAVILVGKNPASRLYVKIKQKRAKEIGIGFKKYLLPENIKQKKITELIQQLNDDKKITAILVQLPLPKHLDTNKIISAINPQKDADGIHPQHLKMLQQGKTPPVLPATTGAIIQAIKSTHVSLKNKSVAIIGKSKIVGLPTYYYLRNRVRQINIYDSATKDLAAKTATADILIAAIGSPKFITAKYIKPGAIVIDVGINKIYPVKSSKAGIMQFNGVNGQTVGDIDAKSIKNKAKYLTPVPGGIGPITVSILLKNVYESTINTN
ncbi:MAG: bifunctional 5,10-methylenetetrahydrofolate dehydrogenase/5,10-methenyltetrahydrofolate cyclohydrolase [Candidatus Kuenenbacteria bacterium]